MSRQKLWQAIGVWSHTHPDIPQLQPENSNSNQPLSSKSSLVEVEFAESGRISHSLEKSMQKNQYGDLSIQIQSCESQSMHSDHDKHDICQFSSKLILEKAIRSKIKAMSEQIKHLKKEVSLLRDAVKGSRSKLNDHLQLLLSNIYNQFSKIAEEKPAIPYQRCEQSKAIIDHLTRQCWQLQASLKDVTKVKQQPLMKKIENSLLQQRGEAVRKLKTELQQAKAENEKLAIQLFAWEQRAGKLQTQYRNSLMAFKDEIEAINQTCCTNIQQMVQEKAALQDELHLLQQRYIQELQIRQKQKMSLTQYKQKNISYTPTTPHQNIFSKNFQFKTAELTNNRKSDSRNTASVIDLDFSNYNTLTQTKPQSFKGQLSRVRPFLNNPQSCKSRDGSEFSFGNALERLGYIQKEVRRQINRSKKIFQ